MNTIDTMDDKKRLKMTIGGWDDSTLEEYDPKKTREDEEKNGLRTLMWLAPSIEIFEGFYNRINGDKYGVRHEAITGKDKKIRAIVYRIFEKADKKQTTVASRIMLAMNNTSPIVQDVIIRNYVPNFRDENIATIMTKMIFTSLTFKELSKLVEKNNLFNLEIMKSLFSNSQHINTCYTNNNDGEFWELYEKSAPNAFHNSTPKFNECKANDIECMQVMTSVEDGYIRLDVTVDDLFIEPGWRKVADEVLSTNKTMSIYLLPTEFVTK